MHGQGEAQRDKKMEKKKAKLKSKLKHTVAIFLVIPTLPLPTSTI